jgi:DNA-binding IclR family transcriptional regulator
MLGATDRSILRHLALGEAGAANIATALSIHPTTVERSLHRMRMAGFVATWASTQRGRLWLLTPGGSAQASASA